MATDLGAIQDAAARSWNLDPTYFRAIGAVESGNNPATPNSPAGASGPMQVMPGTASDMGVTDPSDVMQNTFASAKYISSLLDKYKDPALAAAAYDAGPGRVDDYLNGKSALPDETIAYVPKVAQAYAQLTGSAAAAASPPAAPASYRVAAADPGTASDVAPSPAAPPSGSAGAPAANPFDVLQQAAQAHAGAVAGASGAPAAATPPATPSAPPSAPPSASDAAGADPFSALVSAATRAGSSGAAPGAPAATPSATATPATAPPGFVSAPSGATPTAPPPEGQWHQGVLGNLFSGVSSRFENLAGRVAGLASDVDNAVPALRSLDTSVGLDPTKAAATLKSDVAAADAAGAGSTAYSVGNLIGNIAATAPLVETGAGALGLIGDAAASALPEAATAIRAGTNLLTGGGNATGLAKYATAATSGAAKAVAAGAAAGTGTVAGNALLGGVLGPAVTAVGPTIGKFLTNSGQAISAAPAGVNQLLVRAGQGIAGATRAVAGTAPEDATAAGSAALPLSNRLAAPSAVPPAGSPNLIANQATPVAAGSSAATDASAAASTAAPPAVATAEAAAPTTTVNLGPSASATSTGNAGASTASGFTPSDPPPEAVRLGIFSSPSNAATVGKQIYDSYLAGGPNVAVASKIPGVQLTAAQATGNPMIALLERTRRGLNPTPFTMLDQANATARNNYAQSLIGTPDDLDVARSSLAALDAQAQPQVFGNQQPVSTQPLLDTVRKAVADNAGRPTVQAPLINVANQLQAVTSDDGTALPSDLWNVRKFIGDMVAPRAAGTANDGQAAAAQLIALKPTIDATIEPGAPGFGSYLQQYRQASQPISAMEYLQSKFPTNAQGNVQLGSLDSFVKGINRSQAKSGYSPADDITDEQLQGLTDLRDDLRLAGNVDLGRARGSDTNDRLFTTSKVAGMMQGATPGVAGLLGGAVTGVATGSGLEGGLGAAAGRYVANKLSAAQINRLAAVKTGAEQTLDNLLLNPYGR